MKMLSKSVITSCAVFSESASTPPRSFCSIMVMRPTSRSWLPPERLGSSVCCVRSKCSISRFVWPLVISSPSTLSSTLEMGQQTGVSSSIKRRIGSTMIEPIRSAWREQVACGMISPKMTMSAVATRPPTTPLVMEPRKMERRAFTSVFVSSSVHSSWLPRLRSGRIFPARVHSGSCPPATMICSPVVSSDISPRVRPLARAERQIRMHGSTKSIGRSSSGVAQPMMH
mmetsp:Transcript_3599/g.9047  ORF Transcript_3599/g.9047 Transcript_3599/m.9047 type:complete len:228 (-) Transcript_3599:219-902(-)